MSFLVRLAQDLATVETGATTPATVEIISRSDAPDQFELSIEGLDPDWTAVPVPVVNIAARESQEEKIFFKPPRAAESSAGNYPFVVKVRSLTTGESRTAQGVLAVKPYHHLSIEVSPKKGFISPVRRHNVFEATLVNLGNTEHTAHLFGNDPDDDCAFEFEQEQVVLGPGQERTVAVTVTPKSANLFSGSRLFGFSVSARSIEQPSVVAISQAQLEQKPLISATTFGIALFVLAFIALWIYLFPKPPSLDIRVDQKSITQGQPLTVAWSTTGDPADVHIEWSGGTIYDGPQGAGSQTIPQFAPTTEAGTYEISGYALRDGKRYTARPVELTVAAKPPVADPHITKFSIDQKALYLGQTITIKYAATDATKIVLSPMGTVLDPTLDQAQVTINDLNMNELTLVAYGGENGLKTDKKTISVTVTKQSKASIITFNANPTKIEALDGDATLNWQVTNAVLVKVKPGDGPEVDLQGQLQGERSFHIDKTTVFTLTAVDDAGVETTKAIKVVVEVPPATEPPIPATTGGDPPPPTTTTTGQGGP